MMIYKGLLKHQQKDLSPFHTPGHKNSGFMPDDLIRLDYTELPDTDALYEAEGIIYQTELKLSELFGTKRTIISSGGCTLAIQTMLGLARRRGKKILFARNIHRSAVNACALLDIDPVWIMPRSDSGFFTGRITPDDARATFERNRDAIALYITSPDYYGEISDIPALSRICREYNAVLLVDNAHGSHLAFGSENLHPISLGADMSACSLHKTLPVLTGGAVLNIADEISTLQAKQVMAVFGSTSPSYPIMASIDICCDYLINKNGKMAYSELEKRVSVIKRLAEERGLIMPGGLCDPLRICINTSQAGLASENQIIYFHKHKIEPEFCDGENAVFICTPFNTELDFQRLEKAVSGLNGNLEDKASVIEKLPQVLCSPREAVLSESERLSVKESLGRIAAESACPCPPGVPVVMPGELIDENLLKKMICSGIRDIICIKQKNSVLYNC